MINLNQLSIKTKLHIGIYTILSLAIVVLLVCNRCTRDTANISQQNVKALLDTVQTLKLYNGELVSYKQQYINTRKELEQYVGISSKTIKDLEKQLDSKIDRITYLESSIRIDTVIVETAVTQNTNDSTTYEFHLDKQWIKMNGSLQVVNAVPTTTLYSLSIPTPLVVGMTEDNKVFVTSENPYIDINNIESSIVVQNNKTNKRKPWNIGASAGVGVMYDCIGKSFCAGPYIGFGLSYGFNF